jgi:hypothetical protein
MKQRIRSLLQRTPLAWLLLLLLSTRAYAQLPNDDCTTAVALTTSSVCTVPVNGTVATATQSLPPTTSCGFGLTVANDVWYSFTASSTTHLVTLAPRFAAILDVRSGSCTSSTSVFCTTIANNNTAAVPVTGLVGGQTYFIRVYPATNTPPTGISSTFALCIGQGATGPSNDDCAGAISVPVNTTGTCTNTVSADNTLATASAVGSTPICANYLGRDLWFSVTVPASGNVTVQTVVASSGTDVGDTGMAMYSGTCSNLVELGCNDDGATNLKSLLSYTGRTPGEVLYVRVWSFGNRVSGTIAVCATTPAPIANDDCVNAVTLPVSIPCTTPIAGSVQGASQSLPPSTGCGFATAANDVWYSFTASGATQTLTFTGGFAAVVDVRSGTCASSTSIFCGTAFNSQALTLTGLTGGQTYFLRLYANSNVPPVNGQFTLCLVPGPTAATNDDCANAVALPVTTACTTPVAGTVLGASQSLPPSTGCGFATTANDVWYSFTASGTTQTLTFTGGFAAVVDVRSGTCASSASVFCGTVFNGQPLTLSGITSGQNYFLRIYANATAPPTDAVFTLCLAPGPVAPANDECANAVVLPITTACTTPVSGTVQGASQSLPPTTNCGFVTNANDVWYSFTAGGATQTLTFTGNFGAVVDVRSGTCANSTSVFCGTTFTGQPLTLTGLTNGQTYFLRIFANSTVPVPSPVFTLCLTAGATPAANDDCSAAVAVAVVQNCTNSTNGSVLGASQSLPPSASCGATTYAADVWYSFVASGVTQQITLNPRFQAVMDVQSGTCASSTSVFCTTVFAGNTTGTVVGGLTGGQTYFIRIYANTTVQPVPANATFTLCVSPGPTPPANDDCTTAVALSVAATCTPTSGTLAGAAQSLAPTASCGFGASAQDVWYSFVASGISQAITLDAPQFSAVLDVRSGTCTSSTSLFCTTTLAGQTRATLVGGLTAGQTYFIRVYAASGTQPVGTAAAFTICVTPAPTPPVNDDCAGAITAPVQFGTTCVSQVAANNTGATGSNVPAPGCGGYQGGDVWFKATVPPSGTLTVRTVVPTIGTDVGDTGMSIYSGTCGTLTLLGCDDDNGGSFKSLLTLTGRTPGEDLYIRVWGFNNAVGTLAVCVTSPQVCAAPTALASASIATTSAQLSWTPGGTPAAGTGYTVEYGLQGFVQGTGTVVTAATASLQLTALLPGTAYCFYVRQDCPGGAGSSTYVGPSCFTTVALPVCAVPTGATTTGITLTGAQFAWQPGGTPAAGTTYTVEYGLQGFAQGTGTTVAGITSLSYVISGLLAATDYCYYVRQNCPGPAGSSAYVGPICFRTLTPPAAPANDDACGATTVTLTAAGGPLQPIASTNIGATTSNLPGIVLPACTPSVAPRDVWFVMTPPTGVTAANLTFTGAAAGMVRVFTAPSCSAGPFTLVRCQSSGASNTSVGSMALTGLTPGQRYYIAVSGYNDNDAPGAFTLAGTTVTAARLQADTNALLVYPNPSNTGQLTLKLSNTTHQPATISLLNALGQVVRTAMLPEGAPEHTLNTRDLATGVYTVRVVSGSDVFTRKVTLE